MQALRTNVTPPLKWHGGKHYLAPWISAHMPPHLHYVEPYAGGLSVLLARDPDDPALWLAPHKGVSEVVNDLDGRLVNFWRVLQQEETFESFRRLVEATPLARSEWNAARAHAHDGADPVADAVAFFIHCRQSRAGIMRGFTPITRQRTRRGMNGNVSEWLGAVDGLFAVHARLRRVLIEHMPAIDLIRREDAPSTLLYCDPPYLHETRTTQDAYACEMVEADHRVLLDVLCQCQGKIMVSGYPSTLYDSRLRSWNRHTFDVANHASGRKTKARKTETLWCNY